MRKKFQKNLSNFNELSKKFFCQECKIFYHSCGSRSKNKTKKIVANFDQIRKTLTKLEGVKGIFFFKNIPPEIAVWLRREQEL